MQSFKCVKSRQLQTKPLKALKFLKLLLSIETFVYLKHTTGKKTYEIQVE